MIILIIIVKDEYIYIIYLNHEINLNLISNDFNNILYKKY